ncbi:MAG: TonB-dependent receptor plug domain-containing protein [Flavobacterium sp.]|jgi:TonB-dependent SusC/RagA subfamily outer membrane receptor|nr:TonB-dependent receptor plug domain-containing protein [Flavobacterium sp.]
MKTINKIICTLLLATSFAHAQTSVSGKVLNYKNKPVSGAVMYLDTIATEVATNKLGEYSLDVPEAVKTIKVYSKKYGWLSSAYAKETKMDFMYLDTATTTDKSITPPNGLKPGKDKTTVSYRTIYDMMRGRIAGVTVQQDNTIIIRGINSIRNNSEPLFVVDGNVVSSIDFIVPNEVLSINVLKDAEASIYGSRGASGVIVIKLKK